MKLGHLLEGVAVLDRVGPDDVEIAEVRDDSRAVGPGDLFVAIAGAQADGHAFLDAAARQGAACALVERDLASLPAHGLPSIVRVESTALALGHVAAHRFGDPARSLRLVAVTGTNGKTTTTFLVERVLRAAGRRPGVIGTVNYRYEGPVGPVVVPAPFTTPTPLALHRVLAEMKAAGVTDVVMEASSHALALGRLEGLSFRAAGFTNLTQDHLDFHGTMDAYAEAKALLFRRHLERDGGVGVVLCDGPYGPRMAGAVVGERLLVSLSSSSADLFVKRADFSREGIVAELSTPLGALHVRSRLLGRYNLENLIVAAGLGVALGVPREVIERGLGGAAGVPGRIERVEAATAEAGPARAPLVLVDYAHTHDALENVLATLRPIVAEAGPSARLLCVFGCGGDRDRGKRPKMGRVVARDADLAIVTSDNPRTEDPEAIIAAIVDGARDAGLAQPLALLDEPALAAARRGLFVEPDRRTAIFAAIAAAGPDDVVLIAGKGHEDYQIVGRTKLPFDDREVAREALARARAGRQS